MVLTFLNTFFNLCFLNLCEVQLIYSVVLVSAVQQGNSGADTHLPYSSHDGLSQNSERSSLYCGVGPCCLSVLSNSLPEGREGLGVWD